MIIHLPTGREFNNRKEAKMGMGSEAYKRAVKDREFSFHDDRAHIPFEKDTSFFDNFLEQKRKECIEKGIL